MLRRNMGLAQINGFGQPGWMLQPSPPRRLPVAGRYPGAALGMAGRYRRRGGVQAVHAGASGGCMASQVPGPAADTWRH